MEDEPAPENIEPIPVREPLWEIDPLAGHQVSGQRCICLLGVRATLPSALNVMNASSVGKLVQLVTASRLILYHEGQIDPMKDECHYQIKH